MNNIPLQSIFYALTFFMGTFFGSFLKLVADRSVKGEPIVFSRSKCSFCKKHLNAHNLVPMFSFLVQKGKCSFCKKRLSFLYPIAEVLTGLVFFVTAIHYNIFNSFNIVNITYFIFVLVILSFYIIMTFTDLSDYIIPNKIVYLAILTAFIFISLFTIYNIFTLYNDISNNILGKYLFESGYFKLQVISILRSYAINVVSSLLIALFFIFLIIVTKGKGMGGGDVKLALLIGLFNGFPNNVLAIFLGFVFGSVISVFLIIFKIKTLKDVIPFGPFLILGSIIALYYGDIIIDWYVNLI